MCVCLASVWCVCVSKYRGARTFIQLRAALRGHFFLREHLARTFPDQHYTLGLGSGCPWKNLGKVLWNSVFYAVPFNASCKLLITAPITVTQLDGHAMNYYLWRHRPSPTPTPVSTSSDSNVLAIITRAVLSVLWSEKKIFEKITYGNKKWQAKYPNIGKNEL